MAGTIDEVDFLQEGVGASPGYSARQLRKFSSDSVGVGVFDRSSFKVSFSAGLTFNVNSGIAFIRGRPNADQGKYRARHGATSPQLTAVLPAAHATLPRIDRICIQIQDDAEDSQGNNTPQIVVIAGTPTATASLDNLLGAADVTAVASPSTLLLADVLMNPNNTPALSGSSIRDRRPFACYNTIPPLVTDIDAVMLEAAPGMNKGRFTINGTDHALHQAAALMYLKRRIAATHIRWTYDQDNTTPVSGAQSYIFAVCDASGRIIAQTAATAFSGSANNLIHETVPFNPALPAGFIFDEGAYYLFFGISNLGSTQKFYCPCVINDKSTNQGNVAVAPNMFFHLNSGGTALPTTGRIQDTFQDGYAETFGGADIPVPMVALSIG